MLGAILLTVMAGEDPLVPLNEGQILQLLDSLVALHATNGDISTHTHPDYHEYAADLTIVIAFIATAITMATIHSAKLAVVTAGVAVAILTPLDIPMMIVTAVGRLFDGASLTTVTTVITAVIVAMAAARVVLYLCMLTGQRRFSSAVMARPNPQWMKRARSRRIVVLHQARTLNAHAARKRPNGRQWEPRSSRRSGWPVEAQRRRPRRPKAQRRRRRLSTSRASPDQK